jgi:predicted ATPase
LLSRHRLVTIVGPGGIGKTQLALAVAHVLRDSTRDGVWIVELDSVEKAERVVSAVARSLGHDRSRADGALAALVEAMRAQELLLVLDNCENVAGAVAELISALLAGAPGVKLMLTSQIRMQTPGEHPRRPSVRLRRRFRISEACSFRGQGFVVARLADVDAASL